MKVEFTAGADDQDRRFESVLRKLLPTQTLGAIHRALRSGDLRLNGAKTGPEAKVSAGDKITVWDAMVTGPEPGHRYPSVPPIPGEWILWESADLLAVNKPAGLLVHRGDGSGPAAGEPPLDDRVRSYLVPGQGASLSFRPGPLHRLDRETSGLVFFSKTLAGARSFSKALADRQITKTYLTVLLGRLEGPREVRSSLVRDERSRTTGVSARGADALTSFRPLALAGDLTLAEVDLGTGRTHQIRAHAQSIGLALAGDGKYGGGPTPEGLEVPWLLHAWKLQSALIPLLKAPLSPGTAAWVKKTFKISL